MVQRSRGPRSQTRKVFSRKPRERGLSPITRSLTTYEIGDLVDIIVDPSKHKGMPHRRFHGKTARVVEQRGRSYVMEVRSGGKNKQVITAPEHLRKSKV